MRRYHLTKAVPKTVVNRPIIEFGGMEGFFIGSLSSRFAAFLGTAFLARNRKGQRMHTNLGVLVVGGGRVEYCHMTQ